MGQLATHSSMTSDSGPGFTTSSIRRISSGSVTGRACAGRSALIVFVRWTVKDGFALRFANQSRGPGGPAMMKWSSRGRNQISMRRGSPECRPVVVISTTRSVWRACSISGLMICLHMPGESRSSRLLEVNLNHRASGDELFHGRLAPVPLGFRRRHHTLALFRVGDGSGAGWEIDPR